MNLKQIKIELERTGMPVAYRMFAEQTMPPLPFVVYFETNSNNFKADNRVYQKIQKVQVELYSKTKNETAETKIENVLDTNEFAWDKYETYINDEKVYLTTYDIEYIK